mmetsp:Transcript_17862/g.41326  ORF Transcript_17862/g.41326 Transcript_17862/m.41326 type:complete len:231 (+) Transcript_17862:628-1320(+)
MGFRASASSSARSFSSRDTSSLSSRCMVASKSFVRYFTLAAPFASSTPPRALPAVAYISMTAALIDASSTTQAPPRISAYGGMNTKTGCSYETNASTIRDPYLSTSSNMSRCPPLKPLQFAKTIKGRSSVRKSLIACAVLYAELGNHTHPASWIIDSEALTSAGSAGLTASAVRFSVMTTPIGIPPSLARPTITVFAHPASASVKLPLSKNPLCHTPEESSPPAISVRGS